MTLADASEAYQALLEGHRAHPEDDELHEDMLQGQAGDGDRMAAFDENDKADASMSLTDTEELFDHVWWRGTILTRSAFAVISLMTRDRQHDLLGKFVYIDVEFEDEDENDDA